MVDMRNERGRERGRKGEGEIIMEGKETGRN